MLRLASHHLAVFPGCSVEMIMPLACRDAPAPAACSLPAYRTMLRIVFVAMEECREHFLIPGMYWMKYRQRYFSNLYKKKGTPDFQYFAS